MPRGKGRGKRKNAFLLQLAAERQHESERRESLSHPSLGSRPHPGGREERGMNLIHWISGFASEDGGKGGGGGGEKVGRFLLNQSGRKAEIFSQNSFWPGE